MEQKPETSITAGIEPVTQATPRLAPLEAAEVSENAIFPAESELNALMELIQEAIQNANAPLDIPTTELIAQLDPIIGPDGDILDFENLEAAAAGGGSGGGGDGSTFVRLGRITESVDPLAYEYVFGGQDIFEDVPLAANAQVPSQIEPAVPPTDEPKVDDPKEEPPNPPQDPDPETDPEDPIDPPDEDNPKEDDPDPPDEDPKPEDPAPPDEEDPPVDPEEPDEEDPPVEDPEDPEQPEDPEDPPEDEEPEDPPVGPEDPDDEGPDEEDEDEDPPPPPPPDDEEDDPPVDDGPKGNNGWGNGDQDAPGNSGGNNQAENSDRPNPLEKDKGNGSNPNDNGNPGNSPSNPADDSTGSRNPGNDKEVGNSPWDGETGASSQPGNGKHQDGVDRELEQPGGKEKGQILNYDDLLVDEVSPGRPNGTSFSDLEFMLDHPGRGNKFDVASD